MMDQAMLPSALSTLEEDRRRWALIWFNQLVRFHNVQDTKGGTFGSARLCNKGAVDQVGLRIRRLARRPSVG